MTRRHALSNLLSLSLIGGLASLLGCRRAEAKGVEAETPVPAEPPTATVYTSFDYGANGRMCKNVWHTDDNGVVHLLEHCPLLTMHDTLTIPYVAKEQPFVRARPDALQPYTIGRWDGQAREFVRWDEIGVR